MTTDVATAWTYYDEMTGPALDPQRWTPEKLHLPDGSEYVPLDPNAVRTVRDGQVRVTIPAFSLSQDAFQPADNVKYLMFSADTIELTEDQPAYFGVDLAVRNIGGDGTDVRSGLATLNVVDLAGSGCIFDIAATSKRVFALHERLAFDRAPDSVVDFSYLAESPLLELGDTESGSRDCEIVLHRALSRATWRVNGRVIYQASGVRIPERVRIGFGIFTLLPIENGKSRSVGGQGLEATWRGFRFRTS